MIAAPASSAWWLSQGGISCGLPRGSYFRAVEGSGCHCPPTNASAGADDLGIFFPLRFWLEGRAQELHLQEMNAYGAKRCHSCECHSSPARRLHPKYIHPVAFLKISMEFFHPPGHGRPAGRSSPGGSCCSDSCSQGWSCSPSCQRTHTVSSGYFSIIYRKQIDPFSYYLIIYLFIFSLPGPFWIPL